MKILMFRKYEHGHINILKQLKVLFIIFNIEKRTATYHDLEE